MNKISKTIGAALLAALALLVAAPTAPAAFDLSEFRVDFADADGAAARDAGSHPHAMTTFFRVAIDPEHPGAPDGRIKDAFLEQVAGFAGDTTAYGTCSTLDFLTLESATNLPGCPPETAVGVAAASPINPTSWIQTPVYNLEPPPGAPARLGFRVANQSLVVDARLNPDTDNVVASARNVSEVEPVFGSKTELWGDPSDPGHDDLRGPCAGRNFIVPLTEEFQFDPKPGCSLGVAGRGAFITLPTRCEGENLSRYAGARWEDPGSYLQSGMPDLSDPRWARGFFASPPFRGCELLRQRFGPSISARPTNAAAQSPTGLDFDLEVDDPQIKSTAPEARAQSQIKKAVVELPEGMSANPSVAEGLEVCSESALGRETADSGPGEGCPEASKIGTIEVQSPLVAETLGGALYQATPHDNLAEDSLLAFYIVIKSARLGIVVKQPVRVEPDERTGQLVAYSEDLPQVPFSRFSLHFREGGRSPLVSPPRCGAHTVKAELTPWAGGPAFETSSSFEISSGPGGGPCPPGARPFAPGFEAGTASNAAGSYSPFSLRLTRSDGEQDLQRFTSTLPPGVVAKLAGVAQCPEANIALARTRDGEDEQAAPSCPPESAIGRVIAGAGAGSQLTYVSGALHLAGPIGGAPLSVVAIVPAVAGPFDVGNVVVRQALRIDPRTARVTADGASSELLPRLLAGIPLNTRDVRVYVDRPGFTLNPTSCERFQASALLWGWQGGFASPVAPFQAAGCQSLGFKPRLALRLKGGTKRGGHPSLRGVFRPRQGDANLSRLVLRLPRSAFLDQAHIRTICTRVQFAANGGNGAGCPRAAIYGRARAFTPLLDTPLEGPVFLRSSNNKLPDLVATLHGIVDVEAVARIDSIRGGIRATFTQVPDAPLSKVVVRMQGGKKGLIVNSTDLCRSRSRANVQTSAHSAKRAQIKPVVVPAGCPKKKKARRGSR